MKKLSWYSTESLCSAGWFSQGSVVAMQVAEVVNKLMVLPRYDCYEPEYQHARQNMPIVATMA